MIGRALRTFIGMPLIALAVVPIGLLIGLSGEGEASERLMRAWCRFVLFCAGARVMARVHPLDRSHSYVFVSNHTSHIDVPAIVSVSPEPLRFIAKQELGRIPLFGWAARRMGHVFIDRRDSHGAAKSIGDRIAAPAQAGSRGPPIMWPCSIRRQNSFSRSSRSPFGLPAMSEALIAPIEVPITQSGSIPASVSA